MEVLRIVVLVVLMFAIGVLAKYQHTQQQQIEKQEQIITYQSKEIRRLKAVYSIVEHNVDSLMNRVTYVRNAQINDWYDMSVEVDDLREQVEGNSVMSKEWGEDIFRLHNWYWEMRK